MRKLRSLPALPRGISLPNSNGQFFLYDVSNGKNRFTVYNNTFTIPNGTDLDVDGHTNLDNVSIAGVVTATSFVGSGQNLTNLPASGDSNDITACLFI